MMDEEKYLARLRTLRCSACSNPTVKTDTNMIDTGLYKYCRCSPGKLFHEGCIQEYREKYVGNHIDECSLDDGNVKEDSRGLWFCPDCSFEYQLKGGARKLNNRKVRCAVRLALAINVAAWVLFVLLIIAVVFFFTPPSRETRMMERTILWTALGLFLGLSVLYVACQQYPVGCCPRRRGCTCGHWCFMRGVVVENPVAPIIA